MLKTKLFDGQPTLAQQAIIGFWLLNLAMVAIIAALTAGYDSLTSVVNAFGMLFGLLAVFFALTQFMLMGRIGWIERHFGLDHLASYHRINGYLAIAFILIHPLFITVSYAMRSGLSPLTQAGQLITDYPYVWWALVAEVLFITVVVSSIFIVRKRLKFETWYFVHFMVYAAIVLSAVHPFFISMSFAGNEFPWAKAYWLGLYGFVALNLLIWRFGLPVVNLVRFGWRVDEVVAETPTTTSVYIRGRNLARWHNRPGQFILVRFFQTGLWWQEHPFSLSMIPHGDRLRLTIRAVGDYTAAIRRLKPGTSVLLSGPFGRFTQELAQTDKRLFVAGGVGITPLRSLAEESVTNGQDSVLVYGNKTPDDVPLKSELDALGKQGLKLHYVYSEASVKGSAHGFVDAERLLQLVPDIQRRDIYLCGPPPMMASLVHDLLKCGVQPERLHYERFSLHN